VIDKIKALRSPQKLCESSHQNLVKTLEYDNMGVGGWPTLTAAKLVVVENNVQNRQYPPTNQWFKHFCNGWQERHWSKFIVYRDRRMGFSFRDWYNFCRFPNWKEIFNSKNSINFSTNEGNVRRLTFVSYLQCTP